MRIFVAAVLLLAGCAAGTSPHLDFSAGRQSQLTALLDARRIESHVPGMAVAVVQDGKVIYAHAFGERDIENGAPVTLDTLFPIGSATKSFTAAVALMSQDAGLLSLDDRPQQYLPYFHLADPDADANATLRDMLSHQVGLMAKADLAAVPGVLTREEYIRATMAAVPVAPLRTRFQYSNAMFTAAGEAIAAAHHMTWEELIASSIFMRLGMRDSVANVQDLARFSYHATGYTYDEDGWKAHSPSPMLQAAAPAGAIASSAIDMTHWLMMLTAGGVYEGQRVLSERAFREMTAPQIAINNRLSYALGWAVYDWNGLKVVEHNGGGEGIAALVSFIPERQVGFMLLSNASPWEMTTISHAAQFIYPILLDLPAPEMPSSASQPQIVEPDRATEKPPSVDVLINRMKIAAGGVLVLARHNSFVATATKSYDNQGVVATLAISARAPAAREEREIWSAAGQEIARLRVYFDGSQGGQETTFGQDAINDEAANTRSARANAFRPLLSLRQLYNQIEVASGDTIEGEPTFQLSLGNDGAVEETWWVSHQGRILRRRMPEGIYDFGDFRQVDGETVPFRTVIHDALGQTTITISALHFNLAIPDVTFDPEQR